MREFRIQTHCATELHITVSEYKPLLMAVTRTSKYKRWGSIHRNLHLIDEVLNLVSGGFEADDFGDAHFAHFEDSDQRRADDGVNDDPKLNHDHRPN